jgi:hypothetical protein
MKNILQGVDVISGPVVEAYLLNHTVLLLDEFLQVYRMLCFVLAYKL